MLRMLYRGASSEPDGLSAGASVMLSGAHVQTFGRSINHGRLWAIRFLLFR